MNIIITLLIIGAIIYVYRLYRDANKALKICTYYLATLLVLHEGMEPEHAIALAERRLRDKANAHLAYELLSRAYDSGYVDVPTAHTLWNQLVISYSKQVGK